MTTNPPLVYRYIQKFSCLADRCPDTCCHGAWGMQVGKTIVDRYTKEAPELLDLLEVSEIGGHIVACDASGTCKQYKDGLCGVHAKYGETFLGDACYFYPRITRRIGDQPVMMAAMSCPETVRLILCDDDPFTRVTTDVERLPESIRDISSSPLTVVQMIEIMDSFVGIAGDTGASLNLVVARLLSLGISLDQIPVSLWPVALPFYQKTVDERVLAMRLQSDSGIFLEKILKLMHLFIHVKSHASSQQLYAQLEEIVMGYSGNNLWQDIQASWYQNAGEQGDIVLRRWLQGALVMDNFPFAGLGKSPSDRIRTLVLRYQVVRTCLQLLTFQRKEFPQIDTVIKVMYSIARIFDHLADGVFLVDAAKDIGLFQMEDLLMDMHEDVKEGA